MTTTLLPALAALALALGAAAPQDDGPPSKKEAEALVAEYVLLEAYDAAGLERQDAILARLATLPPLDAQQAAAWSKRIAKRWARGPELEKKGGRHWLWEDEERGLYIVDGKTRKPQGLFIGLHGGGAGSGDAGSTQSQYGNAAEEFDWVAIFPEVLEKTEHGWTDSGTEEFVLELIERACRTWDIDRERVYLGGHSMGGFGTWTLGARHADRFAALFPAAGAPTPIRDHTDAIVDVGPNLVPNLRNVPLVIYQSDDDPRVPPDVNRAAARLLGAARERWGGFDFEYWEVPGRGHDLPPGGTEAQLERLAERARVARPERVVWQPELRWKRQFYWLWWERPARGVLVVADLDRAANTVRIDCESSTRGLHVLLDPELLDFEREVVVEVRGEEVLRALPQRTLPALLATSRGQDPGRSYCAWLRLPD